MGLLMEYSKTKDKRYKRTPRLQEKLDSWLDENVNQPLASKGFGNIGAGLSAAGSTLGSLVESEDDVVAAEVPGIGKLTKGLGKLFGKKAPKKAKEIADDTAEAFEPDQSLAKFKQLKQPPPGEKKGLIGEMSDVQRRKDIRGERKQVKNSKTRQAHDNLKEKKIEEEWERKARLGENPSSPVLDYSKMK